MNLESLRMTLLDFFPYIQPTGSIEGVYRRLTKGPRNNEDLVTYLIDLWNHADAAGISEKSLVENIKKYLNRNQNILEEIYEMRDLIIIIRKNNLKWINKNFEYNSSKGGETNFDTRTPYKKSNETLKNDQRNFKFETKEKKTALEIKNSMMAK